MTSGPQHPTPDTHACSAHPADPSMAPAPDAERCAHGQAFEILSTCHEHIGERLGALEEVGRALRDAPELEQQHLATLGEVLAFLDTAIPIHSADEEQSLFPRLRALPTFAGAVGDTPMDCMEAEHIEHGDEKARLKAAIVTRDAGAVGRHAIALANAYRSHIAKEEEVLYPMARQLLTDPAAIADMTEEMRARRREAGLLKC